MLAHRSCCFGEDVMPLLVTSAEETLPQAILRQQTQADAVPLAQLAPKVDLLLGPGPLAVSRWVPAVIRSSENVTSAQQ
jgi:hypothetical protein